LVYETAYAADSKECKQEFAVSNPGPVELPVSPAGDGVTSILIMKENPLGPQESAPAT
jgi:hypothetical protein